MKKITKKAMTEFVKEQLATNDVWAKRALVVINGQQTKEEQDCAQTAEANGVGFSQVHSFLSKYAEFYEKKDFLSPKQMVVVKKFIKKYHRQVIEFSDMDKLETAYRNKPVVIKKDPVVVQTKLELV